MKQLLGTTPLLALATLIPTALAAQESTLDRALAKAIRGAQGKLQKGVTLYKDHSTWRTARVVKSKYYSLRTTQSYPYAKALTQGLDTMGDHFIGLIRPDYKWTQKAQILLYPDIAAYNQAGDAHGDARSSVYGSFYGASQPQRPVNATFKPNYTMVCIEVTHSATNQFLARAYPGGQRATWIEEGLASYFSLYWSWDWGKSELARFKQQKSLMTIRSLLRSNLSSNANLVHRQFIQLGMLFNYLLHYRPDTKSSPGKHDGPFADYLRKSLQGIDVKNHPVHAVLFGDPEKLQREFRAHQF